MLTFKSSHPWLRGQVEDDEHPGFFEVKGLGLGLGLDSHNGINNYNGSSNGSKVNRMLEDKDKTAEGSKSIMTMTTVSSPNRLRTLQAKNRRDRPFTSSVHQCSLSTPSAVSIYCGRDDASCRKRDVADHWIEGKNESDNFRS